MSSSAITTTKKRSTGCLRRAGKDLQPSREAKVSKVLLEDTSTFRAKKSVALSGTSAGNTALCTVGQNGNELHYRGYNILDLATGCGV